MGRKGHFQKTRRNNRSRRQLSRIDRYDREFYAPDSDIGPIAMLTEYEITEEPLDNWDLDRFGPENRQRILDMAEKVQSDPRPYVRELETMIQEFPDVSMLYNFLTMAYQVNGQYAKCDALIEDTYQRFPNYLFAIVAYGHWCIRKGHPEKVPQILNHKFDLALLYPSRRRFHVTEFVAFTGLLATYFTCIGEMDIADRHLKLLKDIAPDHPSIPQIEAAMDRSILERLINGIGSLLRTGRYRSPRIKKVW